jgi:hypothetical protein
MARAKKVWVECNLTCLPQSVVDAPSVNAFKNRLDNRESLPILYDPICYY